MEYFSQEKQNDEYVDIVGMDGEFQHEYAPRPVLLLQILDHGYWAMLFRAYGSLNESNSKCINLFATETILSRNNSTFSRLGVFAK